MKIYRSDYLKVLFCGLCLFILISNSPGLLAESSDDGNIVDTSKHVKLIHKDVDSISVWLSQNGFDVLPYTQTKNGVELIVTFEEFVWLETQGFELIVLAEGRPYREIQEELRLNPNFIPPGYLDLDEIIAEMTDVANDYPSICKLYDLTTMYDAPPTYEGRHIYAVKISDNVNQDEDEPAFLMVSCHHAREIVTPVLALYAIDQLTSNYSSNPDIKALVNEYEIWIAPVWNPDGYSYVFDVDNMWRKNRHPYYGYFGVDLNRNYPFGWNSSCSGSSDPSSETYKGPSAASEEETQTMIKFSNDRHFSKIIDYHSYGREVLYGYCCHDHPFESYLQGEAVQIATEAGYYGSVRPPSAEGEHYEWQLAYNGSYAFLMETQLTFQPDYSSALSEAIQVWPSTLWMLQRPIPLSGHVTDLYTGDPLEAEITIQDVQFPNGEYFRNEPEYGRYHLFLPPGTYQIEFSVPGYVDQTHEVTITEGVGEVLDVQLSVPNQPPDNPSIDGPTNGKVGETYLYQLTGTDPDDHYLYYYVDWGDGDAEEWIGPYESGDSFPVMHAWDEEGTFTI